MYLSGTQYTKSTSLSISRERSVATVLIQQQAFAEQAIGPITGTFSGNGVVDSTESVIIYDLTAGTSRTIAIYPTNDTSDYWSFTGQITSWSATGPSDGFWEIDFSGIVDGTLTVTGFA